VWTKEAYVLDCVVSFSSFIFVIVSSIYTMPRTKLTSAFKALKKAKEQETRSGKDGADGYLITGRHHRKDNSQWGKERGYNANAHDEAKPCTVQQK
jgi:hypothetical protein